MLPPSLPRALSRATVGVSVILVTTTAALPAMAAPAPSPRSQEVASLVPQTVGETMVRLSDGQKKPAQDVTPQDTVVAAEYVKPEGSLAAQIARTQGSEMGQGKFLSRSVVENFQTPTPRQKKAALEAPSRMGTHYQTPGAILGQDVSSWNADVNFTQEKAKGSEFVYVKTTEGNRAYQNPEFSSQWTQATNVGLVRGAYHFALPNQSDGATQADYFIEQGGGWSADGRTMPGLLDVEWNPYPALGNMCFNMSQAQMRTWITSFQDRYQQRTGRYPAIYTATMWWNTCVGSLPSASRSPLHIASYSTAVGPMPAGTGWNDYDLWQYSSTGPFAGDSNVWGGIRAQFSDFIKNANYRPLGAAIPAVPQGVFGPQDVAVVDQSTGALYRYRNGTTSLTSRQLIAASGWSSATSVHVSDVNQDGVRDLISQWNSGNLAISYGRSDGSFSAPQIVGYGWAPLDITVGQYAVGENFDSILAVDTKGDLRRYSLQGGKPVYRGVIGRGWANLHPRLVQTDGLGAQEVVARYTDGTLRTYRRYNAGGFVAQPAMISGYGWNMSQLAASNPSGNIWLARDRSGNVHRYDFTKDRPIYQGAVGSGGWQTHMIGGSRVF